MNYFQRKFILNIGVILIAFAGMIIFVIYPAMKEIVDIKKEISAERAKLEQSLARGLNINNIKKDLAEVGNSLNQLDVIFIQKGKELEFINQLEQTAVASNVTLETSDFSSQEISANTWEINLPMKAGGDYRSLMNFMQKLENMPSYYNLDLIIVSIQTGKTGGLTMQLLGKTYLTEKP